MQKITNITETMYLQAAEGYSIMVMQNGKITMKSRPLKHFQSHLFALGWYRIHRSFIVNPNYIKQISENRDRLLLASGAILPISRRQIKSVLKWRNQ